LLNIYRSFSFNWGKACFKELLSPLFLYKENKIKSSPYNPSAPWSSILPIHYQFGEGGGVGGFFEIGWETKCTSHTKQTKVEIVFGHKLCGSFIKNSKGKKTRGHLILERNLSFGLPWFVSPFMHTFWVT